MRVTDVLVPGFERVVRADDEVTGLRAFIAVHSTALGRASGGCRMWPFDSDDEALTDVLRLARGMTYKSALAETGLGGGKSVIIADPHRDKKPQLITAMGRFVDRLEGRYIAAEDVGTTSDDMLLMRAVTRFVAGLPVERGGAGNPAPMTALGCFLGLKATVEERFRTSSLRGVRVAVQGLGQVGSRLAGMLALEGARLIVADAVTDRVVDAVLRFGAQSASTADILAADCDVLAPCALGGVIDDRALPRLRCGAIAGAANNQLAEPRHAELLQQRGILYAPDFVINAGGIISVGLEIGGAVHSTDDALIRVRAIPQRLREVYKLARDHGVSTHAAAERMAELRLFGAGGSGIVEDPDSVSP
jgi:leucine dehydrogenase